MVGLPSITWKVPAWATSTSEDAEEVDEPPETRSDPASPQRFRKTPVRRPSEQTSLLTKAIMGHTEDGREEHYWSPESRRRRSITSNVSLASTADLTSDTGFTSPARTNTPSPPIPETVTARLRTPAFQPKNVSLAPQVVDKPLHLQGNNQATGAEVPRKRSIQFACATKPLTENSASRPAPSRVPSAQEAPRRPCIKFACPPKPTCTQGTPPRPHKMPPPRSPRSPKATRKSQSPSTPRKSTTASPATPRPSSSHKKSTAVTPRPKYLRANSNDLGADGSQFHEFACERSREDDWIRHDDCAAKCKLTIDDTLTKENEIRRIAKEAEEEAELEDEEDEAVLDEDDEDLDEDEEDADENNDEDDEDEDDDEDEYSLSEGYHTDEETGFASSDESDAEEDGNMTLWTLSKSPTVRPSTIRPLTRRTSLTEQQSDSSSTSTGHRRRSKMQRIKPHETPDLPDSTDFVCGTLDEDRPLEEAYLSQIAARRNEKLRVIPQDIDPSFPTSEPEDEEDEDIYNPVHHESDDEDFLAGEMEDIHHEADRSRRRRKSNLNSPRKYHSPPPKRHVSPAPRACRARSPAPKRHVSPAPRARAHSPKPLFDRHSPRRPRSPAPKRMTTPNGSPDEGNHVRFNLAARPGLTTTKSLPRPGVFFAKQYRNVKHEQGDDDTHVRGAVDIVKGLERKRQRRKEKFHQKYCSRARRGQVPEKRKAQPGIGAERMKELGLLMAGKKDQGNYVLSV